MTVVEKIIAKYNKQWNKYGMGSVISYSQVIADLEQAKSMEKEQIIKAFDEGQEYEYQYHINSAPKFDSETYYNEL